jgi:hypothetical protein
LGGVLREAEFRDSSVPDREVLFEDRHSGSEDVLATPIVE